MSLQFIVRQTFLLLSCLALFLTVREARMLSQATPALAEIDPCASPMPSASTTPSPTPSSTPNPTPFPDQAILFTEFMACPANGNEWLELFNTTETDIQLTNWQVLDQTNNKKLISGTLPAQEFAVFEWSGSLLNNTGDSFQVFTNLGQQIGSASYSTCDTGISFVYEAGEWVGALESAGEETTVSENTITQATGSAQTTALQTLSNTFTPPTTQLLSDLTAPLTQLTTNYLPRTPPKLTLEQNAHGPSQQPETNAPATPPTPSSPPLAAIWSAIIGGLLQLAPITISAYDQYFRKVT